MTTLTGLLTIPAFIALTASLILLNEYAALNGMYPF